MKQLFVVSPCLIKCSRRVVSQHSVLCDEGRSQSLCVFVEQAVMPDTKPQNNILEIFSNGWTASHAGDKIIFEVDCTGVAVQYRKSVNKPTPIAKVVIDDREDTTMILDGNFDQDWGDCLHIDTVTRHMEAGIHKVEITITEAHEDDVVPFYLVSVIGSN